MCTIILTHPMFPHFSIVFVLIIYSVLNIYILDKCFKFKQHHMWENVNVCKLCTLKYKVYRMRDGLLFYQTCSYHEQRYGQQIHLTLDADLIIHLIHFSGCM